jgi:hypothetical protein
MIVGVRKLQHALPISADRLHIVGWQQAVKSGAD